MWRYFDLSISDFGMILIVCGLVCVILGLTRRAHAPLASVLCGLLLLVSGGLMWLIPRLDISPEIFTRLEFLLAGSALLAVDLVNDYKRLKCTVKNSTNSGSFTANGWRLNGSFHPCMPHSSP